MVSILDTSPPEADKMGPVRLWRGFETTSKYSLLQCTFDQFMMIIPSYKIRVIH